MPRTRPTLCLLVLTPPALRVPLVMRALVVPVLVALASLLPLSAGCVGTAVPQPPNQDPIDPADLEGMPEVVEADFVEYRGMAGAVPAEAQVWLVNLDDEAPQAVSIAGQDGAFVVATAASDGDVLRLSYRTDEGHAQPLDLTAPTVASVSRPACVELALDLTLEASRSAVLAIDSRCAEDVTLTGFAFRRASPALRVDGPSSVVLPPDARFELPVSAAGSDPLEDHLFVFATVDGSTVRYPVSIHVP
ncbi:MAG: hypothetical protein AB8I08_24860 [Sandaracinaceae bacterium]